MFSVMPEARRLAYLEVMGVESYFPRFPLPGAKPSVLCESLPVSDEPMTRESPAQPPVQPVTDGPRQTTGRDTLAALLPQIDGLDKSAAPKPAARTVEAVAQKSEVVRFNLRFLQVPGLAMIVDSSPDSAPEPPIQKLAANILLALSGLNPAWEGAIKANLQQHIFRWPLVGNAQVDQGGQAAKEAVTASVLANQERHAMPLIVLMGEQAAHYAGGEYPAAKILTAESLSHYLINPLAKRELWQSLLSSQ